MPDNRFPVAEPNTRQAGGSASVPAIEKSTEVYIIDGSISRFMVRASAGGLLSALGHNPTISVGDFRGQAHMAEESLDTASVHLTVGAASLRIQDAVNDRDRREMERQMKDEVLETARFPEIVYACSHVAGNQIGPGQFVATLNGQLTLHGVTRDLPVNVRLNVTGNLLKASGDVIIRQTDYGIKLVSAMAGTLRVKDELKLAFDIAARKQKQE